MSIDALLNCDSEPASCPRAVRGESSGTEWLFPIIETMHVLTLTIVFGSIAMVDLRLIGTRPARSSVSRLTEETLPWTWARVGARGN